MKKCAFIIPYFGRFPKSFAVFLKSCASNPNYDWLVFTDDRTKYLYPKNVKVKYMSYKNLTELIDEKFGFTVAMDYPYKLCDLKPAYGFIFEEYIQEYKVWGHCDIDTVLGDLDTFLTDALLAEYDKLFCLGHMTLYKNTFDNNRVFMSIYNGQRLYQQVYKNPASCWFDEEWHDTNNVNQIFLAQNKKVLEVDLSANFSTKTQRFSRVEYRVYKETRGYIEEGLIDALYVWDNGHIYRLRCKDNELVKDEYLYIHLQHRKMRFKEEVLSAPYFKIVPNSYIKLKKLPMSVMEFRFVRKSAISFYALNRFWKYQKKRLDRWKHKIMIATSRWRKR